LIHLSNSKRRALTLGLYRSQLMPIIDYSSSIVTVTER